jgi:CBS-domain-containing membrane protein
MLEYSFIQIFTSEEVRWRGKSLSVAIVKYIHDLKIAARCMVIRGTDGCYENGELATKRIEVLSFNMPLRIDIVLPSSELDRVLPELERMVTDGIVAVQTLQVISHKTRKSLLPKQISVRDVMTTSPKRVTLATPVSEVVKLLLSSVFTGVPVVDDKDRVAGIITQGDLIYKAGMPLRLGLLAESEHERIEAVLESLAGKKAEEIMNRPAISIQEDQPVTEAVDLMLKNGLKRLPVVDAKGRLTGILSRIDVFRTIMKESPDWKAFAAQDIVVTTMHFVSDIMRRDTHTVAPETSVEEVIRVIDTNDIQRVAVVDKTGRFLGLISDRDLLAAFSEHRAGIWDYLVSKTPTESGRKRKEFMERLQAQTAAEVMKTELITVREDTPIQEAIKLMTEKGLKRLPVVGPDGLFKGMISRDSLLRTGFAHSESTLQ